MNSPTSAWWNTTMDMGSTLRHSWVDLAATPKPWDETVSEIHSVKKDRDQNLFVIWSKVKYNSSKYGTLAILYKDYVQTHSIQDKTVPTSQFMLYEAFSMSSPNRDIQCSALQVCPHLWAIQHHSSKTYQRHICHGVDHNSLVLHSVLCDSPEPRFQHMVSIEERLLCSRFHPHLELKTKFQVSHTE